MLSKGLQNFPARNVNLLCVRSYSCPCREEQLLYFNYTFIERQSKLQISVLSNFSETCTIVPKVPVSKTIPIYITMYALKTVPYMHMVNYGIVQNCMVTPEIIKLMLFAEHSLLSIIKLVSWLKQTFSNTQVKDLFCCCCQSHMGIIYLG